MAASGKGQLESNFYFPMDIVVSFRTSSALFLPLKEIKIEQGCATRRNCRLCTYLTVSR